MLHFTILYDFLIPLQSYNRHMKSCISQKGYNSCVLREKAHAVIKKNTNKNMHPKHNWYEKEKGELVKNDVIYERKFLLKTVHKKIAHTEKCHKILIVLCTLSPFLNVLCKKQSRKNVGLLENIIILKI